MAFETSATLLVEMRDTGNDAAWNRFYDFYSPLIFGFCVQKGCSETMARDVLQESMMWVLKQVPDFRYDPAKGKFRSFLLRIVDCRIKDTFKREKWYVSPESGGNDSMSGHWIARIEDSRVDVPGADWDAMWERNLLEQALAHVEQKIQPLTFRSFKLYVIEDRPVEEVQKELGIADRNAVYQHRSRVIKLLKKEVAELEQEMGA